MVRVGVEARRVLLLGCVACWKQLLHHALTAVHGQEAGAAHGRPGKLDSTAEAETDSSNGSGGEAVAELDSMWCWRGLATEVDSSRSRYKSWTAKMGAGVGVVGQQRWESVHGSRCRQEVCMISLGNCLFN